MTYVFAFDHKHRKPPMDMKDLLGGKGANLAEMTSVLGLPVPPGFTITTDACRAYMDGGLAERPRRRGRASTSPSSRRRWAARLGDPTDPLLVSVRSGAKFSMPGMMDTVLNLGLNDESVEGLAKQTGDERFAYDSYRRFISMYGRIVLDIDGESSSTSRFEKAKERDGRDDRRRRPRRGRCAELCDEYKDVVKKRDRQAVPAGPAGAAARRDRGRVPVAGTAPGRSPTASASASATTSAPR